MHFSEVESYPVQVTGSHWVIRAPAEFAQRARDADAYLREKRVWELYSASLNRPPLPPDGRLPIFVLSAAANGGDAGHQFDICESDRPMAAMMINGEVTDRVEFAVTAFHELFHAFQYDAVGRSAVNNWWYEATAAWAEGTVAVSNDVGARDAAFLGHPEIPLDADVNDRGSTDHIYGSLRFIRHLEFLFSSRSTFFSLLRTTFDRVATSADPTLVVTGALREQNVDLGSELGRFWGEHLQAVLGNGPAARMRHEVVLSMDDPVAERTRTIHLSAVQLAADTAAVYAQKLATNSDRVLITVELPQPPPGTYVWTRSGDTPERLGSRPKAIGFCVEKSDSQTPTMPHTGFRVAFTNASDAQTAYAFKVKIARAPAGRCKGKRKLPPEDPDEFTLPKRCPTGVEIAGDPTAPYHGRMYAFATRVSQIFDKTLVNVTLQTEIARRAMRFEKAADRAQRGKVASWWRCGARRIRAVDNPLDPRVPYRFGRPRVVRQTRLDRILARERSKIASAFDRIARAVEANAPRTSARWAIRAATALTVLRTRQQGCEFHGRKNKPCPMPSRDTPNKTPQEEEEIILNLPGGPPPE